MRPDWTDWAFVAIAVLAFVVVAGSFALFTLGVAPPVPESWTHR